MHSWGKLWTTRYKKTKPNPTQLPLLKSREQKQGVGSKSRVLRVPPALNTTEGGAKHLSHPSAVTPGLTLLPSPHIRNQLAPPFMEREREPVTCSRSLLLQQGPQ